MPITHEIPPNPVEAEEAGEGLRSEPSNTPARLRTGRFGELEEHELIHLLDALDDERSRARFRESIYISFIVYLAIGWFLFYGPQVIFHQPRLINPGEALRRQQKELTYLDMPPDVAKQLQHKATDRIADRPHTAQTVKPSLDKKTLESLRAAHSPASTPLPPTPQPQQQMAAAQPSTAPATPQPTPLPQRALPQASSVPSFDAPKPQTKTNFGNAQSAGSVIQQASRGAFQPGSGGVDYDRPSGSHGGLNTGVDILSDTEGVDFGPYLKKILREIKATWLALIPEEARPPLNKAGTTQIRFSILPDGRIGLPNGRPGGMTLEDSTHDDALNRAAWGAITGVGQFPPLPAEFKGENLELRIQFLVNKNP